MAPSYVVETHKSYEPHNHIDTYDTTQCGNLSCSVWQYSTCPCVDGPCVDGPYERVDFIVYYN